MTFSICIIAIYIYIIGTCPSKLSECKFMWIPTSNNEEFGSTESTVEFGCSGGIEPVYVFQGGYARIKFAYLMGNPMVLKT